MAMYQTGAPQPTGYYKPPQQLMPAPPAPAPPAPPTLPPQQYRAPQTQYVNPAYRVSPGGAGIPQPGYSPTPGYAGPAYGGYGSQGYSGGYPAYTGWSPTSEFTDPTTANYERLLNYQAQHYMNPVYDPARSQYAGLMQNMVGALSPNDPSFQNYMGVLNRILGEAGGPSPGESALMNLYGSLSGGGNADAYAAEYRGQLKEDPYTGAEWEAYRTQALDPIESDRAMAQQQALRRISAQGLDPSSGIAQAIQNEVDQGYNESRAAAQNQLAIAANQQRQQRQGLAFQAGLSAEQLKNQARASAIGAASGANAAWSNRMGLLAGTAGDMANALPARLAAQLAPAQGLYGLSQGTRAEQDQRYAHALQLSQTLSQLPALRQAEALAAMGMGETPTGVMNSLGQISGMNYNNQMLSMQNQQNWQAALGQMFGYLQPAWQQQRTTGPVYNDPGFTTGRQPFPVGRGGFSETYPGQSPWTYGSYYPGG